MSFKIVIYLNTRIVCVTFIWLFIEMTIRVDYVVIVLKEGELAMMRHRSSASG